MEHKIQEHKIERDCGLHFVDLRPGGQSLTEDRHDERRDDQAERITHRINEIMELPDPLTGLFSAKLAHRGCGHDSLFDEAIEECKKVFNFDSVAVKSASTLAMQKEAERKTKIRDMARSSARRAGLEVEDDDGESLIPQPRNRGPERVAANPATYAELEADQLDMAGDLSQLSDDARSAVKQQAVKVAHARFNGKFGEAGRYITKKENNNGGADSGGISG